MNALSPIASPGAGHVRDDLQAIFTALQEQPDTWVVGGFIRERYFQRLPLDVDVVVPGQALQLAKDLRRSLKGSLIPLDPQREIFRLVTPRGITVDITRYAGATLAEDLQARDLSINAIACPVTEALLDLAVPFAHLPLFDPCQGAADLKAGWIRGNRRANFEADPLRLLRAFRFAGALGFALEAQTAVWIRELAGRMTEPAAERVLKELELILRLPGSASILAQLHDFKLLGTLIPELNPLPPEAVPAAVEVVHRLELETATLPWPPPLLEAVRLYWSQPLAGGRPRAVALKLAALLTAWPSPDSKLTETIGRRLSLSIKEIELISVLLQHFREFLELETVSPRERYRQYRLAGSELPGLVLMALAYREGNEPPILQEMLRDYLEPANPLAHPPRLVSGRDIMEALQLRPGPLIGEILGVIQEEAAIGMIATPQQALDRASVLLADNRQQIVP